jgi:hypothetical protein
MKRPLSLIAIGVLLGGALTLDSKRQAAAGSVVPAPRTAGAGGAASISSGASRRVGWHSIGHDKGQPPRGTYEAPDRDSLRWQLGSSLCLGTTLTWRWPRPLPGTRRR